MRVFVSYSQEDKGFADKLSANLIDSAMDISTGERILRLGDSIAAGVADAIQTADFFVIVLSKKSENNLWLSSELAVAISARSKTGKPIIIPIVIDQGVKMPPFLTDTVYASFSDSAHYESSLRHLVDQLGAKRESFVHDARAEMRGKTEFIVAEREMLELENMVFLARSVRTRSMIAYVLSLTILCGVVSLLILAILASLGIILEGNRIIVSLLLTVLGVSAGSLAPIAFSRLSKLRAIMARRGRSSGTPE